MVFEAAPLPLLVETLQIVDPEIRASAIHALGEHGERAKFTVPMLIKILGDTLATLENAAKTKAQISDAGPDLVRSILGAIRNIEPATDKTIPNALLDDRDVIENHLPRWRAVHERLAKQFPNVPTPPAPEVSATDGAYQGKSTQNWLKQFEDGDPKFRAEAVRALGGIAQKNPKLIRSWSERSAMPAIWSATKRAMPSAKSARRRIRRLSKSCGERRTQSPVTVWPRRWS